MLERRGVVVEDVALAKRGGGGEQEADAENQHEEPVHLDTRTIFCKVEEGGGGGLFCCCCWLLDLKKTHLVLVCLFFFFFFPLSFFFSLGVVLCLVCLPSFAGDWSVPWLFWP